MKNSVHAALTQARSALAVTVALLIVLSGSLVAIPAQRTLAAGDPAGTPAAITLSPSATAPGSPVSVSGSGFQAGETITVSAPFPLNNGTTATVTASTTASGAGSFSNVTLQVPQNAQVGSVTITASGKASGTSGTASLTVAYQPTLTVSPRTLPPGGNLTVTGTRFPDGAAVHVSLSMQRTDGTTVTLTRDVTATSSGSIKATFTLPSDIQAGTYQASASAASAKASATASFTITLRPAISLSATSVLPAATVNVVGSGFTANAALTISARFPLYTGGSKVVTASTTTAGNGTFSAAITVPAKAAGALVTVSAQGANGKAHARLRVRSLRPAIRVSQAVAPGSAAVVTGSGYLPNAKVTVTLPVRLTNGSTAALQTTATTNAAGQFTANVSVPADVRAGTYRVEARGGATGRMARAALIVRALSPSIAVTPASSAPGSTITVNGSGFAPGVTVTASLQGQVLGSAKTTSSGTFSFTATVPNGTASGSYTVTATSSSGRQASARLSVNRPIASHFYFASIYTGHQEYLAILNPSDVQARVTVQYQLTTGVVHSKTFAVNPHSRYTENVNADLGSNVSTAAMVESDVPIAATQIAYRGSDGAVVPGVTSPSTIWYFADGNTSHNYVEYVALQNPAKTPVSVQVHVLPTHHPAFTITRTLLPTSRLTLKLNQFVHDAVGVTVTSSAPIVADRTIRIHQGMTSKMGVTSPRGTWYFAGGPSNARAHNWLAVVNPSSQQTYVSLHIYGQAGHPLRTVHQWLKPNARVGYLMNRLVGQTDVAVVLQSSRPVVAEQTTYLGREHHVATDAFGVHQPATSWAFAAAGTTLGQQDTLNIFNPGLATMAVSVKFMTAGGQVVQRTYTVGPLAHVGINVGSVAPNSQLGIVTAASAPFVAYNVYTFNYGNGGGASAGTHIAQ